LPIAVPATFQDHRMIAQRSCFTVHGQALEPIADILTTKNIDVAECLIEYHIAPVAVSNLLEELAMLGVSATTIFPDLDHLAKDMTQEIKNP